MDKLLTENEVIGFVSDWLKKDGWAINRFAINSEHGNDIEAVKEGQILIVEAKGAKANDKAKTKKRGSFNSTQIKVHFGKAIIKVLEEKTKNPNIDVAIAQPNSILIRNTLRLCLPQIMKFGIRLFWIDHDGSVKME